MKILRVIASVEPATGGPIAGLRAITPALAKLGHESEFLTVDERSAGYLQSFIAPVHALGPAATAYAYSSRIAPWLNQHLADYDAVVVHGLWQYLGRAVRKASLRPNMPPYFVFPHGMLDPFLRRTYPGKHWKKWFYWLAAERWVERDARAVFFTCEEERRLARTTFPFYSCRERVVAYGTAAPEEATSAWREAWAARSPHLADRAYWLFLGRIHSKKGVELLLRAYGQLYGETDADARQHLPDLVVAGPCIDERYLRSLKKIAADSAIENKVHWPGMLSGDAKWGALDNADAFVLPSYQENFGIAAAEALAVGTPVLISDRVNTWREMVAGNAALVEPPTQAGTLRLLRRWQSLDPSARRILGEGARTCFQSHFEVNQAANHLTAELSNLIRRPDSAA